MIVRRRVLRAFLLGLIVAPVIQGCIVASDEQAPPTRTPIVRSARATNPPAAAVPATPVPTRTASQNPAPATAATAPVASASSPTLPAAQGATSTTQSSAGAATSTTIRPTQAPTTNGGGTNDPTRYTVREGDTLSALSRQFGVSVTELAQANGIAPDAQLRIGQNLQLPGGTWSSERRIRLTRPTSGATVRSPVVVEGTAATFESAIVVELLDPAAAAPLARAAVRVASADLGQHGPFRAELAAPAGAGNRSAVVRVYWTSPRDGSPLDEIRVPVTLAPAG